MTLDKGLIHSIQNLGIAQRKLLDRIIGSFEAGVKTTINPKSDLCQNSAFGDYFANLFSIYHTITEHKFEKKSFEFAFKYACLACDIDAEITGNSSHQGEDIICDGVRFSLKTEGEKPQAVTKISKFSEAAFISKYVTSNEQKKAEALKSDDPKRKLQLDLLEKHRQEGLLPQLVAEFKQTIEHHLNSYDRMVTLKGRATLEKGKITSYRYRLIEIPIELLRNILSLEASDFKPLRKNGGTSAVVMEKNEKIFGVTLDGSDQKITISGIVIDHCITHAEFIVPISI